MIDHLFFDFDGTIADSYPMFERFAFETLQKLNLKTACTHKELMDEMRVNMSSGFEKLISLTPGAPSCGEFRKLLGEWREQHIADSHAFPEVPGVLERLCSEGKKCYLYTHSDSIVYRLSDHMGISRFFTDVVESGQGFPAKPHPDALLSQIKKHNLNPKNCMMIGDRPIDSEAGMNAGMFGCLLDRDGLFPNGRCDFYIRSLTELFGLLQQQE